MAWVNNTIPLQHMYFVFNSLLVRVKYWIFESYFIHCVYVASNFYAGAVVHLTDYDFFARHMNQLLNIVQPPLFCDARDDSVYTAHGGLASVQHVNNVAVQIFRQQRRVVVGSPFFLVEQIMVFT